jgi:quercetin dioxygenase-like cupin family protein
MVAMAAWLAGFACPQSPDAALIVNPDHATWIREANDPPGSESIVLREDARTGGLEMLVSYPPGHVFAPHSHDSNERILLIEGRLAVRRGAEQKFVEPGGYAFLPAREVQRLSCVSRKRCRFYVSWDGDPRTRVEGK